MARKIVVASGNAGKIRELQNLLQDDLIIPQSDFNVSEVEETGLSFVENAIIKARHAAEICQMPVIADDSGLSVDALDGAPGIRSARFAGENASDAQNIEKLLKSLQGIPANDRTARFHCVLVYLLSPRDPCPIIAHGTWEGTILESVQGEGGFGYDPIFFVPEKNCAAAELSADEKNQLSHRGMALRELVYKLQQLG